MRPMLDDLELVQVQELGTYERRALTELKPPGMDGSLLQNLGRGPTQLALWGIASGPDAKGFLGQLEEKFRAGEPVAFVADVVADAEIEEMVIGDFRTQELAGKPERHAYVLTLREYIEPVEPEDVSALDGSILDEASGLVDGLVEGLGLELPFATGLERFVEPLSGLLTRLRQFRQDVDAARNGGA